jgi:hypothetical protein
MEKWQVYLQETNTQIEFAKRSYEAFQSAKASNTVEDVFLHLHHFLIHVANIYKILAIKPDTDRHNILTGHIDLTGIDLNPFQKLRNHLEHFDERLDQWVKDYDGHPFFDKNIVTGAKGFPKKAFLRALDDDTFKFQGEDYDMAELYIFIVEIERRLTTASTRTSFSAGAPKLAG